MTGDNERVSIDEAEDETASLLEKIQILESRVLKLEQEKNKILAQANEEREKRLAQISDIKREIKTLLALSLKDSDLLKTIWGKPSALTQDGSKIIPLLLANIDAQIAAIKSIDEKITYVYDIFGEYNRSSKLAKIREYLEGMKNILKMIEDNSKPENPALQEQRINIIFSVNEDIITLLEMTLIIFLP